MALKFAQKAGAGGGSGGGTYDHNLLINRGLPDQHTIESVTGLRDALARKYEKPFSGIPKTDLSFDVATMRDIDTFRRTEIANLIDDLSALAGEVYDARGDQTTLRKYIDTKVSYADWSGGGGVGGGGHVGSEVGYPLYEEHLANEGQVTFLLQKTYKMGSHQLEVYVNGLRMVLGRDHLETDDHTIDFLFEMEKDDLVLFMVRSVINSGLHEEYIATKGQTSFRLESPYGIYQNILQVFRNGVLQRKGRDYRESDNHTIDFYFGMELDDLITFHQGGATDPIAGTIMESEIGRLKINHAYTTMTLHDIARVRETDYLDMYVDTFISEDNIDKESSLEYQYINEGLEVGEVRIKIDTKAKFLRGITSGTDVTTYPDQMRLANLPGGSEAHAFGQFTQVFQGEPVDDALFVVNNRKTEYYFASIQRASGVTELKAVIRHQAQDGTWTESYLDVHATTGYIFKIQGGADGEGTVHISFHDQGGLSKPAVYYAKIDRFGTLLFTKRISDQNYDAMGADLAVEEDGTVHICYSSKRISQWVHNIEYRYFKDEYESGRYDVTSSLTFDSINSGIAVGKDGHVRVVFETLALNGIFKNIKFVELEKGMKVHELYITTSDLYESVTPNIAIDKRGICRVTWRSKRLADNYGIDYASVYPDYTVSSVKTILSGTASIICGVPRIEADYEDIAHIVFHTNQQRSTQNNIIYAYVYKDDVVGGYENIAYRLDDSFNDPAIQIHGETVSVSFLGAKAGYRIQKRLANYMSSGNYIAILDSRADDTMWQEIQVAEYVPPTASTSYVYRLSNDMVMWTPWKSITEIAADTSGGRILQVRATLTSDTTASPEVFRITGRCQPDTIEVLSIPKHSDKEISSAIVVAKYTGTITFEVSRDGGNTFLVAELEKSVNLIATPSGREIVVKAKIRNGSRLDAWAVVW